MTKGFQYFDMFHDEIRNTDWDEVFAAADRVRQFFDRLSERFPGREELIDKSMRAMLSHHHVAIIGIHGTGKSRFVNEVLGAIKGATVFRAQLTKFTTDDKIFGPVNIKLLKETGELRHVTTGMLPEAHFAYLNEFLLANDALLGALLGIMHERRLQLGSQHFKSPLLTCFADSNPKPEDDPERHKEIAPLIDRFLYRVDIGRLVEPEHRMARLRGAMAKTPADSLGELDVEDIALVAGVVRSHNLVANSYVVAAFEQTTREFHTCQQEQGLITASGRREDWALESAEVSAILAGRTEVTFEDLLDAKLALCTTPRDLEFFGVNVPVILDDWTERSRNQAIEGEREQVSLIMADLPDFDWDDFQDIRDLRKQMELANEVRIALGECELECAPVRREVLDHQDRVIDTVAAIQHRMIEILHASLPAEGDFSNMSLTVEQIRERISLVGDVEAQLRDIEPKKNEVRGEKRRAIDACIRLRSHAETVLTGKE